MSSKAEVFIVESLPNDRKHERLREGLRIAELLRLSGKTFQYYHPHTEAEFLAILKVFKASNYRYLHLSCHGFRGGLSFPFGDVTNDGIAKTIGKYIEGKRLFLSSCHTTGMPLAQRLLGGAGCRSIMGPCNSVLFSDAALFWASFYHLMFKKDEDKMTGEDIKTVGKSLTQLFRLRMKYYSKVDGVITPENLWE